MNRLSRYFLQGLLYLAPISLTIYVVYWIFSFTDSLLQTYLYDFFDIHIPGLGVLVIIVALTVLGYIGQTIIARPFKLIVTKFMKRIPLLNLIYSSVKDFFSAFVGEEKKFNKPVKVTISINENIQRIGFLTNENLTVLNAPGHVAVYFPFSYTFTGETILIPKNLIEPIDLPATEVMKFIIAGGVVEFESKTVDTN